MTKYALHLRWLAILGTLAIAVFLIATCGDWTPTSTSLLTPTSTPTPRSNAFSDSAIRHYR